MTTGTGERARLVLALEAAFVNDVPRVDEQIVFGRVRIRVAGLQPNAEYTVTHPYGVDTFIAEPDGDGFGEINFTEDIGGFNGEDFELALNSRVFHFYNGIRQSHQVLQKDISATQSVTSNCREFVYGSIWATSKLFSN